MQTDHRQTQVRTQQPCWPSHAWAALLLCTLTPSSDLVRADEKRPLVPQPEIVSSRLTDRWVNEPLSIEIPAAPEPFASWIQLGNVTFDFYDPQREPFAYAGETRFEFQYSFRCQTHWRLLTGSGAEQSTGRTARPNSQAQRTPDKPDLLEVRLTYDAVNLSVSHRIRLPKRVAGPAVFDHPLVRHEFDHVAISADSKLQARLKRMLTQRNGVITEPLEDGRWLAGADQQDEPEDAALHEEAAGDLGDDDKQQRRRYAAIARAAVRRESDRVFEEFVEAVAIRHRELDRVTSHGTQPLTPDERPRVIESP